MSVTSWSTLISAQQLSEHIDKSNWLIVDCRYELGKPDAGRLAWSVAHIPGAVYADLETDLSGEKTADSGRHPLPDLDCFRALLSAWGIDHTTQVIAYDANNGSMAAARLWWLLRWVGHERVAVLDGGLVAWQRAGLPMAAAHAPINAISALPTRTSTFVGMVQSDRVVSKTEVLATLHHADRLLVDARASERYSGRTEPLDPVAGHIPGAVNRPLNLNVQADGTFLPAHQLRAQWLSLLNGIEPHQVVHSCGSGVTACHNILAMEVAGLSGSRLYAGSWSEWCKQPGYPVAVGGERG